MKFSNYISISLNKITVEKASYFLNKNVLYIIFGLLVFVSAFYFLFYYFNGLGLAYNDARSHLDIGRRVVEGLKPGLAQLGSVWLPLPHILMVPSIWNDFMWHSGLAGALQSMIAFVATGLIIYLFLSKIGVGYLGRIIGVLVFTLNLNILYLQSTAMTELLLLATMLAGAYELMLWFRDDKMLSLIKSAFWIMLSTLIRYDGWFLLFVAGLLIFLKTLKSRGYKTAEGTFVFFATLGGFGIVLWVLWNQLIFKDALYFIFGPYSARAQQIQLEEAGVLATKGDILLSLKIYFYALMYNSYAFNVVLGVIGAVIFWFDRNIKNGIKIASLALFAPFVFNILALYLGHSVLFIQGLSGNTWFNARYGIMMMPALAIFTGYLVHKLVAFRLPLIGIFLFGIFFAFANTDAVTIDDARVGSSQKNVTEVSGWLNQNAKDEKGFILISAASHDAIIFSSGLAMKRFIHEGTGAYWESATVFPDRWARWIVMRTHDMNDLTFRLVSQTEAYKSGYYVLVDSYPFADIYQLKDEHLGDLNTEPILLNSKL
ncbi:MAG: hypothetical protein A2687_04785 [Candidatus Levybacteria bacterium RIFCSPHIGHO2_01_FULL_38_26]|nr:MAG: hypothetical protein A2687_04785 [Candidatus Levybacteria bacterium RIFCSPHIGHO2_01_FULL_38_26]